MPSEALEAIVALLRERNSSTLPLAERRAAAEDTASLFPPPDDVRFTDADAGGVPAEWTVAPGASADRVVLYFHGGAYSTCSPRTHRRFTAALSRETGANVLVPDYRLAPEHAFPAAVDDAVCAYRWLLNRGLATGHLAVAGDSAGGGLTIAALVAARDAGLRLPAAAAVLSPWTDLELAGESIKTKVDVDPTIQVQSVKESADWYLAGADPRNPLASPIHADLTGLPPLLVHVGSREVLLDDATRLAERARDCGVDVTLEIWPEMIHVWHLFTGLVPEADEGMRRVAKFLREHLAS